MPCSFSTRYVFFCAYASFCAVHTENYSVLHVLSYGKYLRNVMSIKAKKINKTFSENMCSNVMNTVKPVCLRSESFSHTDRASHDHTRAQTLRTIRTDYQPCRYGPYAKVTRTVHLIITTKQSDHAPNTQHRMFVYLVFSLKREAENHALIEGSRHQLGSQHFLSIFIVNRTCIQRTLYFRYFRNALLTHCGITLYF